MKNLTLFHHRRRLTPKMYLVILLELLNFNVAVHKKKSSKLKNWQFYELLNKSKFVNLKKMTMKLFVLFWSTYFCKQTFLTMYINKSKLRSNLTDTNLQSLLRISTSNKLPDGKQLVKNFYDPKMSHWCLFSVIILAKFFILNI